MIYTQAVDVCHSPSYAITNAYVIGPAGRRPRGAAAGLSPFGGAAAAGGRATPGHDMTTSTVLFLCAAWFSASYDFELSKHYRNSSKTRAGMKSPQVP